METGQKHIQTNNKIDQSLTNVLSIQASLSGLSFCILNTSKNVIESYSTIKFDKQLNPQEVLANLIGCFEKKLELQEDFKSIQVIHENDLSTLVPKEVFNENFLADYLKFNAKILRTDFITHDEIPNANMVNIYVPYININNYLFDYFGDFIYKHSTSILLDTILKAEQNCEDSKMYINVSDTHFEVIYVDNSQLILYNTFTYNTDEDFIYYILFTAEQLGLDPEILQLKLLGSIKESDHIYKIVYKYIRHVSLSTLHPKYDFDIEFKKDLINETVLINSF